MGRRVGPPAVRSVVVTRAGEEWCVSAVVPDRDGCAALDRSVSYRWARGRGVLLVSWVDGTPSLLARAQRERVRRALVRELDAAVADYAAWSRARVSS